MTMASNRAETDDKAGSPLTVVLPARNEARSLDSLLPRVKAALPGARVVVVDDASEDDTAAVCARHGVEVVSHSHRMGNGAAIKTGARMVTSDMVAFMDADGQHDPLAVVELVAELETGCDMVVGARRFSSQASVGRGLANAMYCRLASYMTGCAIPDLTSGLRVARTDRFREFLYLLPNGFSYPTTITMAFFRSGYAVRYVPVTVAKRQGKSHIQLWRDGMRFLMIIFKIGTLYSPLKLFLPVSGAFFLAGIGLYLHNYLASQRFTNMSALLLSVSVLIFLIGLVSEQITALMFKDSEKG